MIAKISNFKVSFTIAFSVYLIGMLLSSVIFFLLNINEGELSFDNDLGNWFNIFLHNFRIHIFLIIGGIILSIPTIIIVFINGTVGGFYLTQSIIIDQYQDLFFMVMKHGIFEIPATLISAGISIQISSFIIRRIFIKEKVLFKDLKIWNPFLIMTLLTLIAAIIESI
ncbi:stage II sporulation protein M [Bacillus massilinigeriensis]|uniref:stage II sporulation protein M n=1 Tax=Bacillus mediterraneensis TaxID=1805474 RepID=UPI0008F841A7|nr:stage II sporulation protein M [Bacillus mediterraneensis]